MNSSARIEIDLMLRLQQMPCTPKELRETCPYTPNQILWVLNNLRADGLVQRIPWTFLLMVVDL